MAQSSAHSLAALNAVANEVAIDAMPYVDPEYADPAAKSIVDRLIAEELKTMPKRPDILSSLPHRELQETALPLIAAELGRVARGEAMAQMDLTRYQLEPPEPSKQNDPAAWARAVANAHAQLQHQSLRLTNLELLQQHGPNAWLIHNYQLEAMLKSVRAELEKVQQAVLDLNVQRKASQVEAYAQLSKLEAQWYELTRKNAEIELACAYLEAELAPHRARREAAAAAAAGSAGSAGSGSGAAEDEGSSA